MSIRNGKISLRQALLLFVMMLGSSTIKLVSFYTSQKAGQAGWLSVFFSIPVFIALLLILSGIYKNYTGMSFVDIIIEITGGIAGRVICLIYIVWIISKSSIYIRFLGERMVGTIYPNSSVMVFILAILLVTYYILRNGIEIVARMNELLIIIVVATYMITVVLLLPSIKIDNLTPITGKDVLPIMSGSIISTSLWSALMSILMFSDKITRMDRLLPLGIKACFSLTGLTFFTVLIPLGIYGDNLLQNISQPYFAAVRSISFLGFIEHIEAFIVSIWIFTDFIMISVMTYSSLHIMKKIFGLKDTKHLIGAYLAIVFSFALFSGRRIFDLEHYALSIGLVSSLVAGYGIPVIIFIIGKIRKKI